MSVKVRLVNGGWVVTEVRKKKFIDVLKGWLR